MTDHQEEKKDPDMNPPSQLIGEKKHEYDSEATAKKLKYPKSVFFIVSNEFCERFCFYGMRTILALYLNQSLGYSEDTSTVIYHAFVCFAYLTPLLGAMIADSWLGRFKTIFYLSIVYAFGSVILSLAAMDQFLPAAPFTFLGLILIGFGTGGIKPCVSSFGGDQFVVPEQERQLQQFFSVFYFSVNGGSLLSTFITPILREDVKCFGDDSCYSLAFGVPAVLMVVSIVIFVSGKPLYKIKKPEGNVVLKVSQCIGNGISQRQKNKKTDKRDHWLDYAEEKYGKELVEDVKSALRVLVLFVPLPMFWALFDQQGSRWTFQATRMNGDMGGGFIIKPDQIQVFNPALVMILIPVFEAGVYPLFKKLNIFQKPLRKMTFGGCLAALAFLMSAFVELAITPTQAVLPNAGEAQLRIYNSINCPVTVNITGAYNGVHEISALDVWENTLIKAKNNKEFNMNVKVKDATLCDFTELSTFTGSITEKKALSYVLYENENEIKSTDKITEDLDKSNTGNAKLRVVYNLDDAAGKTIKFTKGSATVSFKLNEDGFTSVEELDTGTYEVSIDGVDFDEYYFGAGGVYSYVLAQKDGTSYVGSVQEVTPSNSINILWQIPQYLTITSGEVMFSITGLEFAFTQAPLSMKSVLTAGWLLTVAFGNIIVIIIAEAKFAENPMWEFILFSGLMFLFMIIFFLMSFRYKYVTVSSEDSKNDANEFNLEKKKEKSSSHENEAFDDHKE